MGSETPRICDPVAAAAEVVAVACGAASTTDENRAITAANFIVMSVL